MTSQYDVLIIGGGPAGLGAAMALGRMSRQVLVCDDNRPRNAPAEHMNNFPSHDGINPAEWRRLVKRDLEKYKTVHFHQGSILAIEKEGAFFRAKLGNGETPKFRKLILAYGVLDKLPPIAGIQELWGKSVYHCPYCHGFEVRGTRLGLIANGKFAEHLFPMIYGLSKDCILFTNGPSELADEFRKGLEARNICLVEGRIHSLSYEGAYLKSIVLESSEVFERDGLFVAPELPFQGKSPIGDELGCEKTEMGFLKVNPFGKTTVEGVFAAGDIVTGQHAVIAAAATGQMAGAAAVSELLQEEFFGIA